MNETLPINFIEKPTLHEGPTFEKEFETEILLLKKNNISPSEDCMQYVYKKIVEISRDFNN